MTINPGLEGLVAAQTALSMVDGQRGELIIAGYPVEELAPNATFEQTVRLLWNGEPIGDRRPLAPITLDLIRHAARRKADPMDALRMAAGTLEPEQLFPPPSAFWRKPSRAAACRRTSSSTLHFSFTGSAWRRRSLHRLSPSAASRGGSPTAWSRGATTG